MAAPKRARPPAAIPEADEVALADGAVEPVDDVPDGLGVALPVVPVALPVKPLPGRAAVATTVWETGS